jgi:hypothetical protein
MDQDRPNTSLRQRWDEARPTKMIVFWTCLASIIATMVIGFTWGGWVTGGTARALAGVTGEDAVVKRLAPICVAQFNETPDKDLKLKEMNEISAWQRPDYVRRQAWATMPGEQEADREVASECARLLMPASE